MWIVLAETETVPRPGGSVCFADGNLPFYMTEGKNDGA
jgi:hypothetical protein